MEDPRKRNVILDTSSIGNYRSSYAKLLDETISAIDENELLKACKKIIEATNNGKRIYVAGNGGSAAIADHLCCDLTKGTCSDGHETIKTHSMVSNVALYSAIANDYGFENVFSTQIDFFGEAGDILIAISSSGNSQNIINAVEKARASGVYVIGMSGFSGGKLKDISDASIFANINNYGIVEDAHQAVMHIIAQFIAASRDNNKQI